MKKIIFYPFIALCVLIIATVVNIGMSYFNSVAMRERRMQGNMSHAMISDTSLEEMFAIQQRIDTLDYSCSELK